MPVISEHVKQTKHRLWMELDLGNVYCASCSDYVYDSELMVPTHCQQSYRNYHDKFIGYGYLPWCVYLVGTGTYGIGTVLTVLYGTYLDTVPLFGNGTYLP